LIEFWPSWCGPCRKSNPNLVNLYHDYNNLGFEIIGVSPENNKSDWIKAIELDKLTWTNVSDLKGSINEGALRYGVNGIPDNVLIDKNGIIVARFTKNRKITRNTRKKIEIEQASRQQCCV
jgi:thiol-disulfide isomerase/thioredoxin